MKKPIIKSSILAPALGWVVFEQTGRVVPALPIETFRGTYRSEGYVYYAVGKETYRRQLVTPDDPKTALQLSKRELFGEAKKHWCELSEAQRKAWQEYALRCFWPGCKWKSPALCGMNGYGRVQVYRQALGLELGKEPPASAPPPAVSAIYQEPAPTPDSFSFRIEHKYSDFDGGYVLVELTRAMPSIRRKPRERDYAWACEESSRCLLPLEASGALYTLAGARFAVGEGERYGVRLTLISPEHVPGEERTADFIKQLG